MNIERLPTSSSARGRLKVAALIGFIALFILVALLVLRAMGVTQPRSTSASLLEGKASATSILAEVGPAGGCPSDWYDSSDPALRDRCGREKGTRTAEQDRSRHQTQTAQPITPANPPAPVPSVAAYSSPPPALLPQPENSKIIRPVDWQTDLNGDRIMHCVARDTTTLWFDGSVPRGDYTHWDPLYVMTRPGNGERAWSCGEGANVVVQTNPTLETFVELTIGGNEKYLHTWTCPRAVRTLQITSIVNTGRVGLNSDGDKFMGLNSIVYFRTADGESGSFDMANQTWTFSP